MSIPRIRFLDTYPPAYRSTDVITTAIGSYVVLPPPRGIGRKRAQVCFIEFVWRNHRGHPRSLHRGFHVVWERYVRIKVALDAFGYWWKYSPEEAREVADVRDELRDRARGLYWTVSMMENTLVFLGTCEAEARIPASWDWTPGDMIDLFPVTATQTSLPPSALRRAGGRAAERLVGSFAGTLAGNLVGASSPKFKKPRQDGEEEGEGTVSDFAFRVAEHVGLYGPPPIDARTEELAAHALEISRRRRP